MIEPEGVKSETRQLAALLKALRSEEAPLPASHWMGLPEEVSAIRRGADEVEKAANALSPAQRAAFAVEVLPALDRAGLQLLLDGRAVQDVTFACSWSPLTRESESLVEFRANVRLARSADKVMIAMTVDRG